MLQRVSGNDEKSIKKASNNHQICIQQANIIYLKSTRPQQFLNETIQYMITWVNTHRKIKSDKQISLSGAILICDDRNTQTKQVQNMPRLLWTLISLPIISLEYGVTQIRCSISINEAEWRIEWRLDHHFLR